MKKRTLATVIRTMLGLSPQDRTPVTLEPGTFGPTLTGETYHHIDPKNGNRIRYPTAWSRAAHRRPLYVRSTRRIVVGYDFVMSLCVKVRA